VDHLWIQNGAVKIPAEAVNLVTEVVTMTMIGKAAAAGEDILLLPAAEAAAEAADAKVLHLWTLKNNVKYLEWVEELVMVAAEAVTKMIMTKITVTIPHLILLVAESILPHPTTAIAEAKGVAVLQPWTQKNNVK